MANSGDINKKRSEEVARVFFNLLFAVIGTLSLIIFNKMSNAIDRVESSVAKLNTQMAISMHLNEEIRKTQSDHEDRIRKLEKNK